MRVDSSATHNCRYEMPCFYGSNLPTWPNHGLTAVSLSMPWLPAESTHWQLLRQCETMRASLSCRVLPPSRSPGVYSAAVCCLRPYPQVFAALEENSVTLSTMKASKYFVVFEKEISYWEKTLSHISETVEIILQARAHTWPHPVQCTHRPHQCTFQDVLSDLQILLWILLMVWARFKACVVLVWYDAS